MSFFKNLFGDSGEAAAAAAAAAAVQPTFDEAMCQKFNQFYDVAPLPQGRVRPVFSEVHPPLELVACSNYNLLLRSDGSKPGPVEITDQVQDIFIKFFNQFELFPSGLATNCGRNLKVLKVSNKELFNKPLKWCPPASPSMDKYLLSSILCKRNFLNEIVENVTKPVVLSWDKYIKDNQQPLDRHQEEYLSTLLQYKLLEGMDRMVEQSIDQYVPTSEETAHHQQFKQKIEGAKKNVERLRERLELNKSSDDADAELFKTNPTFWPLKRMGGKSKRQRRQRSKRRQPKSKKYYK